MYMQYFQHISMDSQSVNLKREDFRMAEHNEDFGRLYQLTLL